MQQNEKLKKELQALRKENARLKIEAESSEHNSQLKEEQLRNIYDLTNVIPWSYDLVLTHKMDAPLHYRQIWTSGEPGNSKSDMDSLLSKIHKDDRKANQRSLE